MKMNIKRWGINGEGIGYNKRKPVFVEGAIPGELVDVKITNRQPKYETGEITEIIEESPRRRRPLCSKWEECGGCSLMHVDYKGQVRMKEQVLKEALHKYTDYSGPIQPILKNPNPVSYRNSLKMPLGKDKNKVVTGMYQSGSNTFVPIERCIVHTKNLEKARAEIVDLLNQYNLPAGSKTGEQLLSLVMKEYDGKVHAVIVTTQDLKIPQELVNDILALDNVESVWQSLKDPTQKGVDVFGEEIVHLGASEEIDLSLGDLKLKMLPRSFFQLNTEQAKNLYSKVMELIPEKNKLLVEAYSGIGAMSLMAADKADEVIGIESIADAVENAGENVRLNQKENVKFICQDAAKGLREISKNRRIDTLIVDPPRSGMNLEMVQAIQKAKPETLIYVSCNPSTLAKNIEELKDLYHIEYVQPVDMFSQTPHVETVVLLKRNK